MTINGIKINQIGPRCQGPSIYLGYLSNIDTCNNTIKEATTCKNTTINIFIYIISVHLHIFTRGLSRIT